MSSATLDITDWSVVSPIASTTLPAATIQPGEPLSVSLSSNLVIDAGGVLSLLDATGLQVDGVAYLGGPATGWSTRLAT